MSDEQTIAARKRDLPTQDEVSTLIWTPEMGKRLSLVRMKMLREQKEFATGLGVTQAAISRIELGHSRVCERFTIAQLKKLIDKHFSFVAFGTNPERYNAGVIARVYWDTRLRIQRSNKSQWSKRRV